MTQNYHIDIGKLLLPTVFLLPINNFLFIDTFTRLDYSLSYLFGSNGVIAMAQSSMQLQGNIYPNVVQNSIPIPSFQCRWCSLMTPYSGLKGMAPDYQERVR